MFGPILEFFGFSYVKLAIAGIALLVFLGMAGTIWFLYGDVKRQAAENESLKITNQTLMDEIVRKEADIAMIKEANATVRSKEARNREKIENLEIKLNALNLGKEAVANPDKIELDVNLDTGFALRCLELASGDVYSPEDRANNICPEYGKP